MNSEFLAQLDYLGQERGISREVLLDSLEKAIATAAKKDAQNPQNITVKINPVTGELKAFSNFLVVATEAEVGK
ncbi:MAG: NusA N-terminal domain-containing protein, partial [Candidatus Nanoarchaeia archaeon]